MQETFQPIIEHNNDTLTFIFWIISVGLIISWLILVIAPRVFPKIFFWLNENVQAIFTVLIVVCLPASLLLSILSTFMPLHNNTLNIEGTQKWAKETYLVEINKTETERLLNSYIKFSDDDTDPLVVNVSHATYYDKRILINLVKIDNEWLLFSNGQELLKAE